MDAAIKLLVSSLGLDYQVQGQCNQELDWDQLAPRLGDILPTGPKACLQGWVMESQLDMEQVRFLSLTIRQLIRVELELVVSQAMDSRMETAMGMELEEMGFPALEFNQVDMVMAMEQGSFRTVANHNGQKLLDWEETMVLGDMEGKNQSME
ncbi:hypothetical protein JRQ81_005632 [Phrynocephalus forsythii]|uniref:Uncharacterized protein n=1 Tax=Phrynocephalus forsythii TaxID=171643 RepID=A0A9Q0XIG1_9SAUR|nr:hypothetical protein JRQ81_005632 [Phrynocephalus forsythii]